VPPNIAAAQPKLLAPVCLVGVPGLFLLRCGRMVGMKRIRLRIGLRLTLLLMALACVLSAYLRASLDLRRESIREDIIKLDDRRLYLENSLRFSPPQAKPGYLSDLAKVKADIAQKHQQIGDGK
jgi:hypothetical protein